MIPADTHIQGFIALRRERRHQRLQAALKHLAVAALIIFGTGTVTLVVDGQQQAASRKLLVDLADCPPVRSPLDPDVVTFTIAMRGDGTPEVTRCTRWYAQMKYQPRTPQ